MLRCYNYFLYQWPSFLFSLSHVSDVLRSYTIILIIVFFCGGWGQYFMREYYPVKKSSLDQSQLTGQPNRLNYYRDLKVWTNRQTSFCILLILVYSLWDTLYVLTHTHTYLYSESIDVQHPLIFSDRFSPSRKLK